AARGEPGGAAGRAPAARPAAAPAAAFDFEKGDHVCLIGDALAERMQHDGWFETLLQERVPDLDLTVRNLGYSGDDGTTQLRVEGCETLDEQLTRCGATVILAFFDSHESRDFVAFVQKLASRPYDGVHVPRIVWFSPIACED